MQPAPPRIKLLYQVHSVAAAQTDEEAARADKAEICCSSSVLNRRWKESER